MQKQKAIAYIDSRNIVHSLQKLNIDSLGYDYRSLAYSLATNDDQYKKDVTIKMYGARYPAKADLKKHHRDDAFYTHVQQVLGIQVFFGHFKGFGNEWIEKGVDVRLATDLIMDAVYQKYDHAYVYSSDTDLVPAIESVLQRFPDKKIMVCLNHNMKHLVEEYKKVGANPITLTATLLNRFGTMKVKPTKGSLKTLTIEKKFGK